MSRSGQSVFSLLVTLLAIVATTGLVGVLSGSSATHAESTRINLDQDVIDIELDQLSVSLNRKVPFSLRSVPRTVRLLENKRIRIRGYILAFEDKEIATFRLNGEISAEDVVADMRLHRSDLRLKYSIPVIVRKGYETGFHHVPFIVEGTLKIEPELKNGQLLNLFRIDDATLVRTKPRDGFLRAFDWRC